MFVCVLCVWLMIVLWIWLWVMQVPMASVVLLCLGIDDLDMLCYNLHCFVVQLPCDSVWDFTMGHADAHGFSCSLLPLNG